MSRKIIQIQKITLIRTAFALLKTIAITVFVHLYSLMQANLLQYGHQIQISILPVPTLFYARYSIGGYILPLILICGFFFKKSGPENQDLKTEIFLKAVSLIALVWLLGCLLAWQLPLYFPIAVIK